MLSENLKAIRKSKGLSQEDLALKLNVVRQTVSKWEQGLSVPDSDLLIALSQALETPVSTLLGENLPLPEPSEPDELKIIAQKLEMLNLRLARRKEERREILHWLLIALCVGTVLVFALLVLLGSPYQAWDFSDPETAVAGTVLHGAEWVFIRVAPVLLIGAAAGAFLTRRKG